MKMLLVILSVLTISVQSKNDVSTDGDVPVGMSAAYSCTYKKGDVRKGDTATLSLNGLGGMIIEQIDVYLKSNKSGGAGIITMKADGQQIFEKSGTYKEWFGAYNNTDSLPITWTGEQTLVAGTLEIKIVGTANSLHIKNYVITYSKPETIPYTVTLMKGNEEMGQLTGKTVELPHWANEGNWQHVGWTETPCNQSTTVPEGVSYGPYSPTKDVTLWAVYVYERSLDEYIATNLNSGYYMYANMNSMRAMTGGIADGLAGSETINKENQEQWYDIVFEDDGTATIQLITTEAYIGFIGTQLVPQKSYWQVYHQGTQTAFYTIVNAKTYFLSPSVLHHDSNTDEYYFATQLIEVTDITSVPTVLIQQPTPGSPIITCYPQYGLGTENVEVGGIELVVPFGIYNLFIKDGKKELRLR